ncbi:MAG: lipopolysaccharide biosynthesis protein [Bacteroidota bacterium]
MTLLSGSVIAQLIAVGLLPWLGLLYPAEAFGIQGIFVATVITLLVSINGGFDQAIMLPDEEGEAQQLLKLSRVIALVGAGLAALLLALLGSWFWPLMDADELVGPWQYLLPLSLLAEGQIQPLRVMLNRRGAYRGLSASRLVQAIVTGGIMVAAGYLVGGFEGLLLGWVIGAWAAWAWMEVVLWRHPALEAGKGLPSLRQVAQTYRDFPQKAIGAGWLNAFSRQLPLYLLPAFYGKEVAGYYFMAQRVLLMPLGLISQAIGEVYYRQATQAFQQGARALQELTDRTVRQLAGMGLIPLLGVMLLGPWAVEWIFGAEWTQTGFFVRWLMPWLYLRFITSPITGLIDIKRRLDFQLNYNLLLFGVRLVALLLAGYFLPPLAGIVLYSLLSALMIGGHLQFLFKISRAK